MAPLSPSAPTPAPTRVRWEILAMLVGFSVVSYVERMNISVAAEFMMPDLGLTQVQMGQVFSAFLFGYALLQIPMGMLGDRFGSYGVLAAIGWTWAVLTLATGWVPGNLTTTAAGSFAVLLGIRFLLGCSIAATYPMAARTVASWQPVFRRAFSYSFVVAGVFIGSAITPPIIAWLMATLGWRQSFYVASLLSVAIAVAWMLRGATRPGEHPGVNAAELRHIRAGRPEEASAPARDGATEGPGADGREVPWWQALRSRSLLLLSVSYFLMGYVLYVFVFWFYVYLVDVREFGIVESGFVAALPFVAAAVLSPLGGTVSDRGVVRLGRRWGRRLPGVVGPVLGAGFLFYGARTGHPYLAVVALALSFGVAEFAEGTVWSTAMDIGGRRTGLAAGIINTANNLGGVVSTALMPVLVQRFGWVTALDSCVLLGVVAGLLWMGVKADRPLHTA